MNESVALLPFEIHVLQHPTNILDTIAYTKDGDKLIDLRCPEDYYRHHSNRSEPEYLKYTVPHHCRFMSVQCERDAEKLLEDYCMHRFFFSSDMILTTKRRDWMPFQVYVKHVNELVYQFRELVEFENALDVYRENASEESLQGLCEHYSKSGLLNLFHLNRSVEWHRAIDFFLANPTAYREEDKIYHWDKSEILEILIAYYKKFKQSITADNKLSYDSDRKSMVCTCTTILSAMYTYRSIDLFYQNHYRECDHPSCHNYYLIDSSHPQTRCPKHMESRQRKRQNYLRRSHDAKTASQRDDKKQE